MQPLDYSRFGARMKGMAPAELDRFLQQELPRALANLWCQAYERECRRARIVVVSLNTFGYLFDQVDERVVAAFGVMVGKHAAVRDHARMAGHPKAEGKDYHRGHLIPHSGHGGTDINLFIQKGSVNVGPFRPLERLAVDHPGSLYFVRLLYTPGSNAQRPSFVEQGIALNVVPPRLESRLFPN